jgi:hypothetical protein
VPTSTIRPDATSSARPYLGTTEGCKPSFWAMRGSFHLWEEYRPSDIVGRFFPDPDDYAQLTLADALRSAPGQDARRRLIRQAIAAMLNAAHESLDYPYSRYEVGIDGRPAIVPTVAELLRTGTTDDIAGFARDLAAANELGCPLSST